MVRSTDGLGQHEDGVQAGLRPPPHPGIARKAGRRASPQVIDQELADQLLAWTQTEAIELLGPDGLLSQVTKAVLDGRWVKS